MASDSRVASGDVGGGVAVALVSLGGRVGAAAPAPPGVGVGRADGVAGWRPELRGRASGGVAAGAWSGEVGRGGWSLERRGCGGWGRTAAGRVELGWRTGGLDLGFQYGPVIYWAQVFKWAKFRFFGGTEPKNRSY